MGVLEFLGVISKEKEILHKLKNNVKDSFTKVKDDIKEQSEWIKHIYNDLSTHKNDTNINIDNHSGHINNINEWINYLNESNKHLKKEVTQLEKNLYSRIRNDFILFNKQLTKAIKDHYSSLEMDKLHKKIAQLESKLESIEQKEVTKVEFIPDNTSLDPSFSLNSTQRGILSLLYESSIPLDYETISKKLNISVISARVYIKKLRDSGIDIETINSGRKVLITISNKQKIKKFYTP